MQYIGKPVQKTIGESDWKSLLIQIWKSDTTRPDEHYLKSSSLDWSAQVERHLGWEHKK